MSKIVEKIEVSSVNNLDTDMRFSGRSLMKIKKCNRPNTEAGGTPVLILSQEED